MAGYCNIRYYAVVYFLWVNKMKPLKEKISITIDSPILEKIKERAELDDRPVSSYINLVLKAHLERLERKEKQQ